MQFPCWYVRVCLCVEFVCEHVCVCVLACGCYMFLSCLTTFLRNLCVFKGVGMCVCVSACEPVCVHGCMCVLHAALMFNYVSVHMCF